MVNTQHISALVTGNIADLGLDCGDSLQMGVPQFIPSFQYGNPRYFRDTPLLGNLRMVFMLQVHVEQ